MSFLLYYLFYFQSGCFTRGMIARKENNCHSILTTEVSHVFVIRIQLFLNEKTKIEIVLMIEMKSQE